jgi:hypothetical protein
VRIPLLGDDAYQSVDQYLGRMCFVRTGQYIADKPSPPPTLTLWRY